MSLNWSSLQLLTQSPLCGFLRLMSVRSVPFSDYRQSNSNDCYLEAGIQILSTNLRSVPIAAVGYNKSRDSKRPIVSTGTIAPIGFVLLIKLGLSRKFQLFKYGRTSTKNLVSPYGNTNNWLSIKRI